MSELGCLFDVFECGKNAEAAWDLFGEGVVVLSPDLSAGKLEGEGKMVCRVG
jgi:hypothetical protein